MIQSLFKQCTKLCGVLLALGLASCSNDGDIDPVPVPEEGVVEQTSVVEHGYVSVQADAGDQTRASYDGRYLNWEVGDKLIAFSNGKVNGTLACTKVEGGNATFEGEMTGFKSDGVNLFFLGNRTVADDDKSLTVDFSSQDGSLDGLSRYLFLKSLNVEFKDEDHDQVFTTGASIQFEGMTSVLRLVLDGSDTPAAAGFKAKQAMVFSSDPAREGLANQMEIGFKDGAVKAKYDRNTTVAPATAAGYATEFYMAVIPVESDASKAERQDLTMNVWYQDGNAGSSIVTFKGINWTGLLGGKRYKTNWPAKNIEPEYTSSKTGYSGGSVEGDRGDGQNTKTGYSGGSIEGDREDGTSSKPGYGGSGL